MRYSSIVPLNWSKQAIRIYTTSQFGKQAEIVFIIIIIMLFEIIWVPWGSTMERGEGGGSWLGTPSAFRIGRWRASLLSEMIGKARGTCVGESVC